MLHIYTVMSELNEQVLLKTFSGVFLNEIVPIFFQLSLKFIPKSPIDINSVLVQLLVWSRTGDKPLT